jgi:uncharacterized damage-inducible protein DinB
MPIHFGDKSHFENFYGEFFMSDKKLRENLTEFLQEGPAHASFVDALEGIHPENRNNHVNTSIHTIWEELEHMRLCQEDILRFTLDSTWKSPAWPSGYWPQETQSLSDEQWHQTISGYKADLNSVIQLVNDSTIDLTHTLPHDSWRTYLREILLIIDHNAYHLGKIVDIRKLLSDWHH